MKINRENPVKEYMEVVEALPAFVDYVFWEGLKERIILLNTEISAIVVEYATMQILRFNREDEAAGIPAEKRKPIKIYIHSNGGEVIAGMNLIDVIQDSVTPVHTIGLGLSASMGGLILMAGHVRMAYPHSVVLIHDGSLGVQGSAKKAKQTMKFYDDLEVRLKDYILGNTSITEEMYKTKEDEEWFMFADEALKLGIIDIIIGQGHDGVEIGGEVH